MVGDRWPADPDPPSWSSWIHLPPGVRPREDLSTVARLETRHWSSSIRSLIPTASQHSSSRQARWTTCAGIFGRDRLDGRHGGDGQDVILGYHRRDFPSLLRHENAEHIFRRIREVTGQDVHVIESDHELIRTRWGHQTGFSTDSGRRGVHRSCWLTNSTWDRLPLEARSTTYGCGAADSFGQFEETIHWSFWRTRF